MAKTTAKTEHAVSERETRAAELRARGLPYRAIAAELGFRSVSGAFDAVRRAMELARREPIEAARDIELTRLDALQAAYWPQAIAGDVRAATVVLSIIDRRARMAGVDAPAKVDVNAWVREMAQAEGLDPEQAVRDAEAMLQKMGW